MSMTSRNKTALNILLLTFLFVIGIAIPLLGQIQLNKSDNGVLTIKGQWFLSYQAGEIKGNEFNQFFLKRGYITVEKSLSAKITGRITPDISVDREGDGEGDVELRLKYCYLKYELPSTKIFTKPFIEFGLVHRPWLDFEGHINHYRVQGTMFLERNKIFNSADYGVTLVSYFGGEMDDDYKKNVSKSYPGKYGSLAVGIYNGGGYHAIEKNTNKTIEGRFTVRPLVQSFPGLQLTYLGAIGKGNTESAPDWALHAGFLSWEHQNFVLTGMYFSGEGNSSGSAVQSFGEPLRQDGYSFFGEFKFFSQKFSVIGRYDYFNSETELNNSISQRFIMGLAYHFIKGCKILFDYDSVETNNSNKKEDSIFELAVEVRY